MKTRLEGIETLVGRQINRFEAVGIKTCLEGIATAIPIINRIAGKVGIKTCLESIAPSGKFQRTNSKLQTKNKRCLKFGIGCDLLFGACNFPPWGQRVLRQVRIYLSGVGIVVGIKTCLEGIATNRRSQKIRRLSRN